MWLHAKQQHDNHLTFKRWMLRKEKRNVETAVVLCVAVHLLSAQHPASQQVATVILTYAKSPSLSNWHCAEAPLSPFFSFPVIESALQTFSLKMSMQHNADSLWRPAFLLWQTSPLILITGASRYRRCWSLAERPPLCRDKCRILALGTAVSAAGESGHIGSWLPQFSFSLVESKKSFHSVKNLFPPLCPVSYGDKVAAQEQEATKADRTLIGSFQRPDWKHFRLELCKTDAAVRTRLKEASQALSVSESLSSAFVFPLFWASVFWRAPDVCVWLSGVDTRRRKRRPQTLLESGNHARSMKQRPSCKRDVTAGIWLVLHHAASRSRCGSSLFSTRRGSKKCWSASAAHSPRSRGPNRFWGFVPCQIQDSVKINK